MSASHKELVLIGSAAIMPEMRRRAVTLDLFPAGFISKGPHTAGFHA